MKTGMVIEISNMHSAVTRTTTMKHLPILLETEMLKINYQHMKHEFSVSETLERSKYYN